MYKMYVGLVRVHLCTCTCMYVHTYICIGVVFQLAAEFILIERRILYSFCVPDRK